MNKKILLAAAEIILILVAGLYLAVRSADFKAPIMQYEPVGDCGK